MEYLIRYYCVNHRGRHRNINQDNFLCIQTYKEIKKQEATIKGEAFSANGFAFAVFDGMGGEEKGELAAYIAAQSFSEQNYRKAKEKTLVDYAQQANKAVYQYAANNGISSMGTTLAMLCFTKRRIRLCNVGDSKIYRLSTDGIKQISTDHILAAAYSSKPSLSQNLGISETELVIVPYTTTLKYRDGDVYLICSDGFSDMVNTPQTVQIINNTPEVDAADALLNAALEKGGRDNITVILIYVKRKG